MSWPTERLGSVAELVREGVDPQSVPAGTRYVGLENIGSDGSFSEAAEISPSELTSTKFVFTNRHILFGKLRPYLRKTVRPAFSGICSTDIVPIAPSLRVDRNYLFHFLRTDEVVERATTMASGANLPRISPKHLVEFQVPLPPIAEQQRIAAILDQADCLRRSRKAAMQRAEQLLEALYWEFFVYGGNDSWPLVKIGELAENMRTGPFGSQLLHSEFVGSGISVLGIDNAVNNRFEWGARRYISEDKYRSMKRYTVNPNDIIITIMGTCGRCAIVPENISVAINTKHLCCVTLDLSRASPAFIHAAFLTDPDIKKQLGMQAKGAVMPGLNMGIIAGLALKLPPLALQEEFGAAIRQTNSLMDDQKNSLAKADRLFRSLESQAFAGGL